MRKNGDRLAGSDPALKRGVMGWFDFQRSSRNLRRAPSWEAHFRNGRDAHDLVMPMYGARLARADGVLHVVGYEDHGRTNVKASPVYRPQSWLLAWRPMDARALLERVQSSGMFASLDDDDESDTLYAKLMEEPSPPSPLPSR